MREGRISGDRGSSRRDNDDDRLPIKDNATASKFQWKKLLKESGNSMIDGEGRGVRGDYGRDNDVLDEGLMPVRGEMISNLPNCPYSLGNAEHRGSSRNVTIGGSVEDPNCRGRVRSVNDHRIEDLNCRGRVRNMADHGVEDGGYRRAKNMTGSPIESVRKMSGFPLEDGEFRGHSRTVMIELPVKEAAYHRCLRNEMNVSPGEDAGYQRPIRRVHGHLDEDGGHFPARNYGYSRHMDRGIPMKSYEEDDCYRYRNGDSSRSLTPRSHSNGQHTSIRGIPFTNSDVPQREVFHHPAEGVGIGGSISPSNCYNSHGISYPKVGTNGYDVSNDVCAGPRAEYHSNLSRRVVYTHPENQRSGKVYKRELSEHIHDKYDNVQHDLGDPFGNETFDSALSRHWIVGNSHNCTHHNYGHIVQEEPIMDVDNASRSGCRTIEYEVIMDTDVENGIYGHTVQEEPIMDVDNVSRSGHRTIEYEVIMDTDVENGIGASYENRFHKEQFHYENNVPVVSHEDDTRMYPTSEEEALINHEDARRRLQSGDIDSNDQRSRMSKKKRKCIGKTSLPKRKTSTLGGRGALSYDQSCAFDSKATTRMSRTEPRMPFGGLSKELQSRLSKPHESGRTNVKNRLNPRFVPSLYGLTNSKYFVEKVNSCSKSSVIVNHATSTSQLNGKAQRTSVKKRLKAAAHMDVGLLDPQASHPDLDLESQQNLASKNSSTTKEVGALLEADPDHSILKVKPTEKDPPDNSEELSRQVDYWFSKCMLYLNARPGRVKKFKDQGIAGNLKCIICSSSKEFSQTKDVATHAFSSLKVGLRAPHLGFHRALCVLMGWDPHVSSNGRWICKSLPDFEARALKEDLILWPPVIVIHNGSVGDFYNNELVKISVEQLHNTLRDMGLSEGKATICHGKPGNPNIMLVKFNGTLSGLQEAERLDKVFSEKKRGRANLHEVVAGLGCSDRVVREVDNKIAHDISSLHEAERLNMAFSEKNCERENLQEVDAGVGCSKIVVQAADNMTGDTDLQEAERLDKVFSKKKHGREEIDAGVGCCGRAVQEADNKIEDTPSGLQNSERLDKDIPEKQYGKANFQEVDVGVGCSERVVQEADNKVEGTPPGLQEAGLEKVFSEKQCEKTNFEEENARFGCHKRVIQEADNKIEDSLSDLQEAERLDKVSEKKRGRENLEDVDAGVACSKIVVLKADKKMADGLSGLQDAESLDKTLTEKKHGRTNFNEVDVGVGCSERGVRDAGNKIEDTLYGYLGIVEDLDKLNYELKRRVVGKSKKEILACVDTATV